MADGKRKKMKKKTKRTETRIRMRESFCRRHRRACRNHQVHDHTQKDADRDNLLALESARVGPGSNLRLPAFERRNGWQIRH